MGIGQENGVHAENPKQIKPPVTAAEKGGP